MRLYITGDSHIASLSQGVQSYLNGVADITLHRQPMGSQARLCEDFFRLEGGEIVMIEPTVASFTPKLPHPDYPRENTIYVFSVGFHTAHFAWVTEKFAHFTTHKDEPYIASTAVISAIVEGKQKYQKQFVAALAESGFRFMVVEAPLIFRNSPYCLDRNADTIAYYERVVREDFSNHLTKLGIPVVRVPAGLIDADGFMDNSYRHPDPDDLHHASQEWGSAIAPNIFEIAKKLSAS